MSIANPQRAPAGSVNLDPTIPAPMTNVAEYGFEGRFEDWADDARYFEYSKAANPIGSGYAPQVPITQFGPEIYMDQPTGVVPLDLSKELGIETGDATSPALLANFVRIRAAEQIDTSPNATSQLYYVLYGRGFAAINGRLVKFEKGDFLTLPAGAHSVFYADAETAMYWVHDAPLLRYLGAEAREPKFRATKFRRSDAVAKLDDIASRPGANDKSRVSALLANANQGADADHHPRPLGNVRGAAGRPRAAPASAPIGRTGSDPRCTTERLLHLAGHPPR
jgi:mannose-6-phosphate isomerase-like protein (cupin superfamily)